MGGGHVAATYILRDEGIEKAEDEADSEEEEDDEASQSYPPLPPGMDMLVYA